MRSGHVPDRLGSARRVHQGGGVGVQPFFHDLCRQVGPSCLPPRLCHPLDFLRECQWRPHLPVQPIVRGRGQLPACLPVRLGEGRAPPWAGSSARWVEQCATSRSVGPTGGRRPVDDTGDPGAVGTGRALRRQVEQHVAGLAGSPGAGTALRSAARTRGSRRSRRPRPRGRRPRGSRRCRQAHDPSPHSNR